ncbi:hypothetical protein [Pseudomonas viridiflava]|uniref:hypothetical protein n=1 Tax=Pseudomonas viridiflava TaxID=33069 RepID=UPI000F0382A3|nr:hypothetical protein [Pseudomonas viridiflava]
MNELRHQQAALITELESLEKSLSQLEAEWRNTSSNYSAEGNMIGSPERDAASEKISNLQSRIRAIPSELAAIERELTYLEQAEKIGRIKADALQAMSEGADQVSALEKKKAYVTERLLSIQSEADTALQKAQQAERDAATSYARCLANGDSEGEKAANSDIQKAAKQLATTDEQVRRQDLVLSALQAELDVLDTQLTAAQKRGEDAKAAALDAVEFALREKWDAAAEHLAALGGRLVAISHQKGGIGDSLNRLKVPRFGPTNTTLDLSDLTARAHALSVEELLLA